jgi:hypothetical protein
MNSDNKQLPLEMSENMAEHRRYFSRQSRWRIDWRNGLKSEFKSGLPTIRVFRRIFIILLGLFVGVLSGIVFGLLGVAPVYGVVVGSILTWMYLIILSFRTFRRNTSY